MARYFYTLKDESFRHVSRLSLPCGSDFVKTKPAGIPAEGSFRFAEAMVKKMKKTIKRTALVLAVIAALFSFESCSLTDLFEKAGVSTKPVSTVSPDQSGEIEYPDTLEAKEQMDMSKIDLSQYMTLDYKGIRLATSYQRRDITEDVLNKELLYLLVQSDKYTLETGRKTAEGDWIEMSFKGFMEGEEFEGGSSEKSTILLDKENSGYIPGFADGLIGVDPGTTVTLNLNFPETYYSDLAGKPVKFEVTVKGICGGKITEEVASSLSNGKYKSESEFRDYFRKYLEELEDSQVLSDVYNSIWTTLEAKAQYTGYPEEQYTYYYNSEVNYIIGYAKYYGIDYDTALEYLGFTPDTLKETVLNYVHQDMILNYIASAEHIELTDEAYRDYLEQMVTYYNSQGYTYTAEEIEEGINAQYGEGYLKARAFEEKVCTAVYQYAEVTYLPPETESETTAANG